MSWICCDLALREASALIMRAGRIRTQAGLSGVAYTSIGGLRRKKSPATVREADRARCSRLLRLDPPVADGWGLDFHRIWSGSGHEPVCQDCQSSISGAAFGEAKRRLRIRSKAERAL
jgi:hypothetical protein